jgi:PIN domain
MNFSSDGGICHLMTPGDPHKSHLWDPEYNGRPRHEPTQRIVDSSGVTKEGILAQTPMQVVLDSSIYRADLSFAGLGFSSLRRLCALNIVQLFIPSVVEREVLSILHQDGAQAFAQYTAALTKLQRYKPTSMPLDFYLWAAKNDEEEVHSSIRKQWDHFKTITGAFVSDIAPSHGSRVMDAYFRGLPPFSAAKSRKDIPDAFTHAVLLDLAGEPGGVAFVSSDKRFLEACRGTPGVVLFDSIPGFLVSEAVRVRRVSVDNEQRLTGTRALLIRSESAIRFKSEAGIRLFLMKNAEVFPAHGGPETAGVWSWPDISLDELDVHQLQDLSPNDWIIPFTARIAVSSIPPGVDAVPFLSSITSSPAEDPDHTVFALRGLLGISLPEEKSLLDVTDKDIRVQVLP